MQSMKPFVRFHLRPAFVVLTITLAGCGGGWLYSPGLRIRDADRQFDAAEAFRITAGKDTEQEKRHEQVKRKKALYDETYNAYWLVLKADPTGKYAQRSLWQIAEIYKRRYEWDKVVETYNAIIAIAPSGYYADRAKNGIADICKSRLLIEEEQRKYQRHRALYVQDNARENYDIAAQALYEVAESYEQLEDYSEAIAHYQRVVDEFPEHEKASASLTKIGYIHYYELYDYVGGWPAYNKVIELYPNTYDATQAVRLLEETGDTFKEIANNQAEAHKRYHSMKAIEWNQSKQARGTKSGCLLIAQDEYSPPHYVDIVHFITASCFRAIGQRWEDLRNYPSAIVTYRLLADKLANYTPTAADARYQIGRLYQLNGQFDQAIEAYQELFDKNPESTWRAEGIYQQAVCYRGIREFAKAYEGFKAYMNLGSNAEYHREAEKIVRQFETDRDGDGYKFYVEQEAGTSDQDPDDFPRSKS